MGLLSHEEEGRLDPETFAELYNHWRPELVLLCRRLLPPGRIDAEDVAQETFLRAWLARDRYSSVKPFWPWLATIARRLCVDWRRRVTPTFLADLTEDLEPMVPAPDGSVAISQDLERTIRALDALRAPERRALVLREFTGRSYKEIAVLEGVTVESVRGSVKRARASLRDAIPLR